MGNRLETSDYPDEPPPPVIDRATEESLIKGDLSRSFVDDDKENGEPTDFYCPFCPMDYDRQAFLDEHVIQSHAREVKNFLEDFSDEPSVYYCPFCTAKFYVTELLPKHIIRKHEIGVLNMFSSSSLDKYVYCRFCPHKSLRKHYKLLMIHIEKTHFQQFEKYVRLKYCNLTNSQENLLGVTQDDIVCVKKADDVVSPRSILNLKNANNDSVDGSEPIYANVEVRRAKRLRHVRFQLPDSPPADQENLVGKKRRSRMPNLKNLVSKKMKICNDPSSSGSGQTDPSESDRPLHKFKCGLCRELFDANDQLVGHLKAKHKGLKFRAQYRCGICSARFYRNSCLVKHSWLHQHAPLCLKTPTGKSNKYKVNRF
ncbi:Hypothetical protein NTJ_11511 [Nesidiocoris tenuis]|nr:Hypothetical protein NTJ_11511 [Nesidiocoris tenuis]